MHKHVQMAVCFSCNVVCLYHAHKPCMHDYPMTMLPFILYAHHCNIVPTTFAYPHASPGCQQHPSHPSAAAAAAITSISSSIDHIHHQQHPSCIHHINQQQHRSHPSSTTRSVAQGAWAIRRRFRWPGWRWWVRRQRAADPAPTPATHTQSPAAAACTGAEDAKRAAGSADAFGRARRCACGLYKHWEE